MGGRGEALLSLFAQTIQLDLDTRAHAFALSAWSKVDFLRICQMDGLNCLSRTTLPKVSVSMNWKAVCCFAGFVPL